EAAEDRSRGRTRPAARERRQGRRPETKSGGTAGRGGERGEGSRRRREPDARRHTAGRADVRPRLDPRLRPAAGDEAAHSGTVAVRGRPIVDRALVGGGAELAARLDPEAVEGEGDASGRGQIQGGVPLAPILDQRDVDVRTGGGLGAEHRRAVWF